MFGKASGVMLIKSETETALKSSSSRYAALTAWWSWRTTARRRKRREDDKLERYERQAAASSTRRRTRSPSRPPPPRIAAARVRAAAPAPAPAASPWSPSCRRRSSMNFLGEIEIDVGVDEEGSVQGVVDEWRVCTRGLRLRRGDGGGRRWRRWQAAWTTYFGGS
jgi:hypothetical protein